MNETRQTIEKILAEIEPAVEPAAVAQPTAPVENAALTASMEELRKWQERNNQIFVIGTDYPLNCGRPVVGKLIVFLQRVVRKMIRPIIAPIVSKQNELNMSLTASVNAVYNHNQVLNAQIQELKAEIERLKGTQG